MTVTAETPLADVKKRETGVTMTAEELHQGTGYESILLLYAEADREASRSPRQNAARQGGKRNVQQPVPVAIDSRRILVDDGLDMGMPPEHVRQGHPRNADFDKVSTPGGGSADESETSPSPQVHWSLLS